MGIIGLSFAATIIVLQCMYCSSFASKCQWYNNNYGGLMTLIILIMTGNYSGFVENPSSMTIEVEEGLQREAVFRCRHQHIDTVIGWQINRSTSRLYPDVVDSFIYDSNGTRVDTLTIPAIPEYNGTEVVCVANFFDGSPREVTPPAVFIVIGMLADLYLYQEC